MRKSNHTSVLFFYGVSIVGLMLYTSGFFPVEDLLIKNDLAAENHEKMQMEIQKERYIQKLVFFIIDALRHDFITSMPFLHSSIQNNKACLLTTKAHAPTVTMPRIKAITSGMIPSFFDVILNFRSSSFSHDNFITQAYKNGYQLVFYGDDTWLKLFPNHFIRYEGTSSFFASDYTEVDNNVTRNVYKELGRNDWDIMILHYLGLDHIGHMEGPKSLLVEPKLKEMDMIVKKIAGVLNEDDLLIVTGDHGMKDSGSHGGVTFPEMTVPLVTVGQACYQLSGWPTDQTIPQIDIAPTLSILLGLQIPNHSVGKLIPQILNKLTPKKILKELENNWKLLLNKNIDNLTIHNEPQLVNEYFIQLTELSESASKSKTEFKLTFLYIGCLLFWISSGFFIFKLFHHLRPKKISHWVLIIGLIAHTVSYGSTSFIEEEHQTWYFFWITLCILQVLTSFQVTNGVVWIMICFAHRLLRKLNQTGDKWASLPDIQNYLSSAGKERWLLMLFLLGIAGLFYCCWSEKCTFGQILTYGMTLLIIICYRLAVNSIHFDYFSYPASRGGFEVKLFWMGIAIVTIQTFLNHTPIYLIWSLLAGILFRPHNVILIPAEIIISRQIHKFFDKQTDIIWNNIAHVWLGYVFYFYQGNGNSIANIDVASGFVGLEKYEPIYAGFMMEAHTSSAIILSFLLSPKSNLIFAGLRIIPHAFYSTLLIFQLHHLFIWSVFSPKLLFETNLTIVVFICILVNTLMYKDNK